MRFLIVTSNYSPEPTGIAVYSTDLARLLSTSGHDVSVLTTLPHYPWWKIPTEHSSFKTGLHHEKGIRIFRCRHYIPTSSNAITRVAYELSIFLKFLPFVFRTRKNDYDKIIAFTPTVASALIGKILSRKSRIPLGLVIQDLSGIGAAQSGLKGGALASKLAEKIELGIYSSATSLVAVSKSIRRYLIKNDFPEDSVNLIFNYSTFEFKEIPKAVARERLGLPESIFLLLHTGNMGLKQDLGNVIEAAKFLEGNNDIRILLIGNGNQELLLKSMADNLSNVDLIQTVDQDSLYNYLNASDVLILNERATQTDMSLPSKLTTYFTSKRPILAAVSKDGATAEFIGANAYLLDPGKPAEFANAVIHLVENSRLRGELGNRAYSFARNFLSCDIGHDLYLSWAQNI